jgi:pimeloyl-ACP methyl ester carboxylesterase
VRLAETTWDGPALRNLRRRDFPPCNHPTNDSSRHPNAHSERLARALGARVFPHVESALLGLSARPAARALVGSSYSAALALQVLLHDPEAVDAFILGSPSTPFDPELVTWLHDAPVPTSLAPPAAFVAYGASEREPPPPAGEAQTATPGVPFTSDHRNVHRQIPDASHALAALLRARGAHVDGAHAIDGEDHTSLKLALIARGVSWLIGWWSGRRSGGDAEAESAARGRKRTHAGD